MQPSSNPFATRFTRPGALAYRFAEGQDAERLVDALASQGWWGQIVGPHGSGKSTLLHTLAVGVAQRGRKIVWLTQTQGQRRLAVSHEDAAAWDSATLVMIDGYEQLGWLTRRWLKGVCRRQGAGLLVTAHEDVGLPPLATTAPDLATLQVLVAELLPGQDTGLVGPEDVSECYQAHAGNARETLFALYDLYERRRLQRL
jgi:hypothetical protein